MPGFRICCLRSQKDLGILKDTFKCIEDRNDLYLITSLLSSNHPVSLLTQNEVQSLTNWLSTGTSFSVMDSLRAELPLIHIFECWHNPNASHLTGAHE